MNVRNQNAPSSLLALIQIPKKLQSNDSRILGLRQLPDDSFLALSR